MKNTIEFALVLIIAFSLAACGEDKPDNDPPDTHPGGNDNKWTAASNTPFGTNTINSVAWGNGVFVAAGAGGKIAYSADGKTWTAAANSTFGNDTINCVAWGNGKFMAGGEGGRMVSSSDKGLTWVSAGSSGFNSNKINGLAYGTDKWVAVGDNRMAYSNADGTSWTSMDSNTPFSYTQGSPALQAVAFGGGKFVLVGAAGGQAHGASLASSANGINWTERPEMGDMVASALIGVCYGNNKFVTLSTDTILYSTAADWDAVPFEAGRQTAGVAAGNGKFIAVGPYGTILSSANGINWTALELDAPLTGYHFNDIVYGNGTWVAVGLNGVIAYFVEE